MAGFYEELDRREARAQQDRLDKSFAQQQGNLHDYQGCAEERRQQVNDKEVPIPEEWKDFYESLPEGHPARMLVESIAALAAAVDALKAKYLTEQVLRISSECESDRIRAERDAMKGEVASANFYAARVKTEMGKLNDALARQAAPLTDDEWMGLCGGDRVDMADVQRHEVDALIAARAATQDAGTQGFPRDKTDEWEERQDAGKIGGGE